MTPAKLMGLNVNLIKMLGIAGEVHCPKCKTQFAAGFDDYDIECGKPNTFPGKWKLSCYCDTCGHVFYVNVETHPSISYVSDQ